MPSRSFGNSRSVALSKPLAECFIDGVKGFADTVVIALLVVGFIWVTEAADAKAESRCSTIHVAAAGETATRMGA